MNEGTIRQIAPPEELYDRPRTTWVADFIGSPPMNLIEGVARNGTIELAGNNTVALGVDAAPGNVSIGVRPENLSVSIERPAAGYTVEGRVDTVEPLGEYTLVNVHVGDVPVTAKVPDTNVERGDVVYLTFDDDATYVYEESGLNR
jgi:multiple sugar transport system ATP-binding protein